MASMKTPLLEVRGLSKRYAGLEAVKSVDLRLGHGEVRGVIGPNGAGKTTLVNMLIGKIKPTAGAIFYRSMEITGLPMYKRASMGIVYSSQTISLFHSLTVVENVEVAALRRLGRGVDAVDLDGYVRDILKDVGLEDFGDMEAGKLPYGSQRLLEISMALSLQPVLLILDEPTEGLSAEEMGKIMGLLRSLSGDKTLLIIEHNIRFVMELAQMVTVMADGSVIAEGRPSEVENDALIQRIYLGS